MHSIEHAQFCWSDVPENDRPLLEHIGKRQIWERLSQKMDWVLCCRWENLESEDKALLQWAQSTFGPTWVFWNTPDTMSLSACESAAAEGDVMAMKWARINGCDWNETTCQIAAENGNYDVLKWARENGCPWDEITCEVTAAAGRLDILIWLRGHHYKYRSARSPGELGFLYGDLVRSRDDVCPWDARTCEAAAAGGHVVLLRWARFHGCDWNAKTCCEAAAAGGHLEILKWARLEGCRLPAKIYEIAAAYGHLNILQWARNYKALKSAKICAAAAAGNHADVLAWARENGCQ